MVLLLLLSLTVSFAVRRDEICPVLPLAVPADPCPKAWIGYQRKCYYFSMTEGNWNSGSTHCYSHNASLALVDSQEEMDFLLRHKSLPDHWIGLQKDSGQPWRWVNGSIFKGWLDTEGGRRCGYLNHKGVANSSCTREERWICSREMTKCVAEAEPLSVNPEVLDFGFVFSTVPLAVESPGSAGRTSFGEEKRALEIASNDQFYKH